MPRKCKKTTEAIKLRINAYYRLGKIKGFSPGLPQPEIFGIETTKTGPLTINDIFEEL